MKNSKLLLLGFVIIILGLFLCFGNSCTEGGLGGKYCNCQGVKLLISADKFTDGQQTYVCLGIKK